MKLPVQLFTAFFLGLILLSGSVTAETEAPEVSKELFIDLSSGQMSKVRRAFMVGTKMRQIQKIPVTINMSMGSVVFANKDLPRAKMVKAMGTSVHDLMQGFLDTGGVVYVCPMCMHGNGLEEADLLPGFKVGGPDVVLPKIMQDGVKTLSY